MKEINGEIYRLLREKRYKEYIVILLLSVIGCFGCLLLFEREIKDFSIDVLEDFKNVYSGITSYNFGLFKIWDMRSDSLSSVENIFNAVIPSGNIALFVGVFGISYAYSFRKQTSMFLEVCKCKSYEITAVLVIIEIVIANICSLLYEICLGMICVLWGVFHSISYTLPQGFGLWILCLHFNITAFTLFVTMVTVLAKKQRIAILVCISSILAGNSCVKLVKILLHLPDSIDRIWILNNIMYFPVNAISSVSIMGVIGAALITCFFAIGLILLEISLNNKERYK